MSAVDQIKIKNRPTKQSVQRDTSRSLMNIRKSIEMSVRFKMEIYASGYIQ